MSRSRVITRGLMTLALGTLACSTKTEEPAPLPVPSVQALPPPDSQPAALPPPVSVDSTVDAEALHVVDMPPPDTITVVARPLRICAGGDVMLGGNLDTLWATRASSRLGRAISPLPNPDDLLSPLGPLVADADILLLNVEGAIGEGPAPSKCRPGSTRCYAFRQPVAAASALARVLPHGRVVGNVANNHAMDAGGTGFAATQRHLVAAGVQVTGADTVATVVETPAGDTVAFLGFATAQAGPDPRDLVSVRRHVRRAAVRYPRVVVTMHMGSEGRDAQRTPDAPESYAGEDRGNMVAFARAAVEAGASLVVGHGPHVMRAAEWYQGALVVYSLGNLLTYGPFNLSEPMNRGAIVCADLDADGSVVDALVRSTWQAPPGLVAPDPSARAAFLLDSLSQLDFPSTAAVVLPEARLLRPAPVP